MIGGARAQYVAWRGAAFAIPALPSPVDPVLARGFGALAYAATPRSRANVRANLEVIAPSLSRDEREALVRRAFENQARNYLLTLRLPRLDLRAVAARVPVDGWEHVDAALAAGRGVVLASAHFGPVALVGPLALATHHTHAAIVAEALPQRLFELMNRHLRGSLGATFVSSTQVVTLLRMLKRGQVVGVLGDRPVAGARVRLPFFGREAALPVGHLVLAARTGAALIPGFARPGPRGELQAPLELSGADDDAVRADLGRWATILERLIATAPDEWHVFERFWTS